MPIIEENPFLDTFFIDLGTTNSAVSIIQNNQIVSVEDENGNFTIPSCVAYTRGGPIVGLSAKNRITGQRDPVITNSKRLIGQSKANIKNTDNHLYGTKVDWVGEFPKFDIGGVHITPTDVAKDILLYAKKLAERKMGNSVMKNVVITVPAYFNNDQREATREAARLAGLNVDTLLDEPTSATLSYSIENTFENEKQNVLVFDFGGGTFDVSIVEISNEQHTVLNTDGDNCLGGSDIDVQIAVEAMNCYEKKTGYPLIDFECDPNAEKLFNNLKMDCEKAKIALSVYDEVCIDLTPYLFLDEEEEEEEDDAMTMFVVKSTDLEEWSKEYMEKCKNTLLRCIKGAQLTTSDISQVITVGGSSFLHCVKNMLNELFHDKVYSDPHPERCVSRGAAAYLLNRNKRMKVVQMKTPYDICIQLGNNDLFVMIPKGQNVPISAQQVFTTDMDLQSTVSTSLCQKNQDGVVQKLHPITLNKVPRMRKGEPRLLLTVSISKTNDVSIQCIETVTNTKVDVLMQEVYI